jgi:hypothetical protein
MGKVIQYARDTLTSLVSGLGTQRDKSNTTGYIAYIPNPAELSTVYRTSWLARKIVTIPALDATRKWRNWQADYDTIELLEKEERRIDVQRKILQAKTKARLFGSAAIYIGTGDGNPQMPLEPERIGKEGILFLHVMERKDLNAGDIERDPESPYYGQPAWYSLHRADEAKEIKIHPSRLVRFVGEPVLDEYAKNAAWGDGDSVLTSCLEVIRQTDSVVANVASLVFEAKIDVVRVPDMMNSLTDPEYESRLMNRFALAMTAKGINGTLLLDKEEEYDTKSPSLAQLPEIISKFTELCSGAADIPATRLLGQSPSGMNSTGESDLRNYYDRVQSIQELELTPQMAVLDECIIRSATGARDESIYYVWAPLWQITDKEKADIGKLDVEMIKVLNETGLYPEEAVANAGINLLTEHGTLPGFDDAVDEAGGLPDYDALAQEEAERTMAELAMKKGVDPSAPPAVKPPTQPNGKPVVQ